MLVQRQRVEYLLLAEILAAEVVRGHWSLVELEESVGHFSRGALNTVLGEKLSLRDFESRANDVITIV